MKETISVTFASLYPEIQRHLSVIGKRLHDKDGSNLFSSVTLSSAERPILNQYLQEAAQNVTVEIKEFVSAYTETDSSVTFMVTNTRWNDPYTPSFVESFAYNFTKYLVYYTLAEYLSMTFTDYAKKYFEQALARLKAIIALVFFKAPPSANDASVIAQTTIGQTLHIKATARGTSSFVFNIPLSALADVYKKWENLSIDCSAQSQDGRAIDLYKADNTPILRNRQLPCQLSGYDVASLENAAGGDAYVVAVPSFRVTLDDTLLLLYSTTH